MAPRRVMPPRCRVLHILAALALVLFAVLPARSFAAEITASLSSLTISPEAIPGGQSTTGLVTLTAAAPPGGAVVILDSSNPDIAFTPDSVTVSEGVTSTTFSIQTNGVNQSTTVKLSAFYGVVRSATVAVLAPVAGLMFDPYTLVGGGSTTGTVVLAEPAPAGGALVTLSSRETNVVQVPASVTVLEGAQTAEFDVTTKPVGANSGGRVSAFYNGGIAWGSLTVMAPSLVTFTVESPTVKAGSASVGTITLDGPAPTNGRTIGLSSSNAAVASVPTSVVVPAEARSVSFYISTGNVTQTTLATLTATAGAVSTSVTVAVAPVVLIGLALNSTTVVGGNAASGTVTIDSPAPAGGIVVALSSSAPKVASVPTTVTIPAGARTASFPVSTTRVTRSSTVVITSTYNSNGATATLTVAKR